MKTLEFRVKDQVVRLAEDPGSLVSGSKQYLKVHFRFEDSEWFRMKKVCVFSTDTIEESPVVVDGANSCEVPDEIAAEKSFRLYLVGGSGSKRIKTKSITIRQD